MMSFPTRLGTHAKYLGKMMQLCGVDPEQVAHDRLGLTFATVARTCMACAFPEKCHVWLQAADGTRVNDPPAFCPNAERFRRTRAR